MIHGWAVSHAFYLCGCIYKCTWLYFYMHTHMCVHISTKYQHILLFSKKHPASSLAENVPSLWLISAFTFDLCGLPKARSAMKGKRIKASRQATSWFMQKKREDATVCPHRNITIVLSSQLCVLPHRCAPEQGHILSVSVFGGCLLQPIVCQMRLQLTGTKYLKVIS